MGGNISTLGQTQGGRVAGVVGFTFAVQAAFAAYSVPAQSDKFYDLAGSLGFISTTLVSLMSPAIISRFSHGRRIPFTFPTLQSHHPRQLLISGMIALWAGRLGYYLFGRVLKHGKDSRFDEIKKNTGQFSVAWFGQATWITLVSLPAILVNTIPRAAHPALGIRDLIGVGIWAGGLGLEILADSQKSQWRSEKDSKKHDEKFISSGLWSVSRHPNYLGEVLLQFGPPILSTAVAPPQWRYIGFVSPLFTYLLLRYASGVPPLEKSAEKKWGNEEDWARYRDSTGVLIPEVGKGKVA